MIARLLFSLVILLMVRYGTASGSDLVTASTATKSLPLLVPYQATNYAKLKAEAEKFYAEKSFSRAHELYLQMDRKQVALDEARWIEFRIADTLWRAQAATNTNDDTKFQQARQQLESLVKEGIGETKERDRVWAEAHESLGDYFWTRQNARNYAPAWPHYQQALEYWAGTKDIETARQRYLQIVWTMADPPSREQYYYYGYYGNHISLDILDNVLKIANNDNDKARAHYLIAMTIRQRYGDAEQMQRVPEEFEAALKTGKASDWYDDALYHYAEWMQQQGRTIITPDGGWRQEQDFVKALELFRRLMNEFSKGETRYYDQAKSYADNITKPSLSVHTSNVFLPDSEMQFHLNWRNVKQVNFALYKVDLTRDVQLSSRRDNWLQSITLNERIKAWTKQTNDKGDHKPGNENVRVDSKLPVGAYIIEASAGNEKARELLLVTDTTLVVKSAGKQTLVYFCNALDGSPVANATIKLWAQDYENNQTVWRAFTQQTNQEGIAMIDLQKNQNSLRLFVAASLNNRQAISQGYSYDYNRGNERWKIYAFTDRPAYRPKETVNWKFVARQYNNETYSTPANQTIEYEITDPKGTKVNSGKANLNSFGSAWGTLEIADNQPLGQYNIQFFDNGRQHNIGSAQLFRIEEYKLPEFKVAVSTPEENGQKKAFKLGEKVEVQVQSDYYFGGAVANADIELVVHQNPFYHYYRPTRDYDWYYEDENRRNYYGGQRGQVIKREKIKTDANGKATFSFETPRGYGQDLEYFIEARVTDSSRREITGSGTVRVTRQRYYVYPQAKHNLYRPNDKVAADIKALDANNQPVQTEGTIKVTRDFWYEIWTDANGREVKGDELKRLQNQARIMRQAFPPANWKLKFRGYQHDDIATQTVKTNDKGEAEFSFTPAREGYYRIAWSSSDKGTAIIRGETAVWVTTNATTELGYRHGGLEIIVDNDTARAGQKTPVMITTPVSNRWVLFSVEGESLMSYQLLHLDGTAKLIELPIETKHEPNVFLSAAMVNERQLFTDTKQLIVPPDRHFLNVEVTANQSQYQPREDGTLTVTTKDRDGKPVSAEVSLGLVDESVFYIQSDLAGDPRKFYYGQKRGQSVQTNSSFQQKQYLKLVEGDNKQLMDDRISLKRESEFRRVDDRDQAVDIDFQAKERGRQTITLQGGQSGAFGAFFGLSYSSDSLSNLGGAVARDAISNSPIAFSEDPKLEASAGANEFAGGPFSSRQPNVVVRNDFRSTVFWQPDVVTDKNGKATVKVKYPDSTTSWKATARAATSQNQFGIGDGTTRTKMPLLVRLQAPRFFVVGDQVTVSAVINNNTEQALTVAPTINADGVVVSGFVIDGKPVKGEQTPVNIAPNSEKRVDWLVSVSQAGNAKLKVTARSDKFADAMERSFVVHEHGVEKFLAKSGKLRGDEVTIKLDLPPMRKAEATNLTVQVTPSLAVTMLDALPYLIDYPYGCVEQTMSRYLPAAITAKTLKDLKLDPEEAMSKVFGGIERQFVGKTQPQGARSLHQVDELVEKGLARLYDMQHADGGWGWWKEGESDHFMTAYVVWGLTLGQAADVRCKDDVLARGAAFLDKELVEEENNFDQQAWMLHALAAHHKSKPSEFQRKAFDNLWANREKLNAYTCALLALSAHHFGFADKAKILVQNLENGVKRDNAPDTSILIKGEQKSDASTMGTAHWGADGLYYRWSDGGVEATAWALRALLAIDPNNKLIEPVTNWLIKNRRGAQWSNTRDTAMVVLTMNEYLRTSGELNAELEYDVFVNGQTIATKKLTPAEVFSAPSQFAIKPEFIKDGANEIRIARKSGKGALYFAANAQFFSREEGIRAAGNEIFVKREYYKLVGRPTLLKGYVYDKVKLTEGETVNSGDRIETVLTIEAKNNYEYLLFEDLKPAGFEAVQLQSGKPLYAHQLKESDIATNRPPTTDHRSLWVYQELRDRKVALFMDRLPEGVWQIRYEMRAETPGQFHALPVLGHAMYVPEIRCNSEEMKVVVDQQ